MRTRAVVAAVIMAVVAVFGFQVSASAAPVIPAHTTTQATTQNVWSDKETRDGPTLSSSCAAVRANLARLAANGEQRQALCFERGGAARDFGTAAIQPLPAYCDTVPVNGIWYADVRDRTKECGFDRGAVQIFAGNGALIGTLLVGLEHYSYTANNGLSWSQQVRLFPLAGQGDLSGLKVEGAFFCDGACQVTNSNFPSQNALSGIPSGEGSFSSTLVTGRADAQTAVGIQFTKPGTIGSPALYYGPGPVRCDNEVPGTVPAGCIFSAIPPLMTYSLSGPYFSLAQHIYAAQQSNLPGAPGPNYADGRPLSRSTNAALNTANRNRACPASFPRPTGFSCDEYPFASTYQGAETQFLQGGTARTFDGCQVAGVPFGQVNSPSIGWSLCMINATQNSTGGSALNSQLYVANRVLDQDPFFVRIDP